MYISNDNILFINTGSVLFIYAGKQMKIIFELKKKIFSKRGETLTETLSSLLIIVPAMVMLAGAIVTAAHINSEARSSKASNLPEYIIIEDNKVISDEEYYLRAESDDLFTDVTITWYNEEGSIYYYFR